MRNILVVGGSTGIGKSLVDQLVSSGENVIATYNRTEPESHSERFHKLNVLDQELDLSFVPDVLDGLVYCPGSINLLPFHRIKPQAFLDDYDLQVVGAIRVLQGLLKNLKKSDLASVVLFSTVAVQSGYNFHSQVAASKGAIEGLTRSLAAELAPKVRINTIAPSLTQTPLADRLLNSEEKIEANAQRHPLQRIGQPEDMANMASFLLSDESSWITGQIMKVDGGASTVKS